MNNRAALRLATATCALATITLLSTAAFGAPLTVAIEGPSANGDVDGVAFTNQSFRFEIDIDDTTADVGTEDAFGVYRYSSAARITIGGTTYELAGDSASVQLSLEDISLHSSGGSGDRVFFHPQSGGFLQVIAGNDTFYPQLWTDNQVLSSANSGASATNNTADQYNNGSFIRFEALDCTRYGYPPNDPDCISLFGPDRALVTSTGQRISINGNSPAGAGDWTVSVNAGPPPPPQPIRVAIEGPSASGDVDGVAFTNQSFRFEIDIDDDTADVGTEDAFGVYRYSNAARIIIGGTTYELAGNSASVQLSLEDISLHSSGGTGDRVFFHPQSGGFLQVIAGNDTFYPQLWTNNQVLSSANHGASATNNTADQYNNGSFIRFEALDCTRYGYPPNDPDCISLFGPDRALVTTTGQRISINGNSPAGAGDWTVSVNAAPTGPVCGDGNVEAPEECDGGACCASDCTFASAMTECRAAGTGVCDPAEFCTGSSATCPADAVAMAGTECRASAGVCDAAEACDGTNAACPADGFSTGNECRAAAGACDVAETCDGSGVACPVDALANAGTTCRASTNSCDPAELCDGAVATCPADVVITEGTDTDNDSLPNSCDPDDDNDGVNDEDDNCVLGASTTQDNWTAGTKYEPGAIVQNFGKLWQCTSDAAASAWCGQIGYEPGPPDRQVYWSVVWTETSACGNPQPACTTDVWSLGATYTSGQRVVSEGFEYACSGFPSTAWCGIAPDFQPGVGLYWTLAWVQVQQCN